MDNYIDLNQKLWNARTQVHLTSDFYDMGAFREGKSSLNDIELALLGDIRGKRILHLQCHFGQDTLSLARMGAQVVGVDFSTEAIATARTLTEELGLDAKFICCNVYDLKQHLSKHETFDFIFTSYGVMGWLPDLEAWAKLIYQYLRPQGQLILVEFHPVVWMFDNYFTKIEYTYFKTEPIVEQIDGTYADRKADLNYTEVSWNHSLSEVFQALFKNNLQVVDFNEFDYSPYNCFQSMISTPKGYQIAPLKGKIPLVYALKAQK